MKTRTKARLKNGQGIAQFKLSERRQPADKREKPVAMPLILQEFKTKSASKSTTQDGEPDSSFAIVVAIGPSLIVSTRRKFI
jgi:hypothetical protein